MKGLTHERALELFDYDAVTGIMRRRAAVSNAPAGSVVGTKKKRARGGLYLGARLHYRTVKLHRLIFFYMTGRWPLLVDHINGDSLDNRWLNLREADHEQNARNKMPYGRYLKGTKRQGNRWGAKITFQRKEIWLGSFGTEQEAHAAYCSKARELFGDFARFQ